MTIIRWIAFVWYTMCMTMPAAALDYHAGITAGTASLHGDNATSDPGAALGLTYEVNVAPYLRLGIETAYLHTAGTSKITERSSIFYGSHEYDTSFLAGGITARLMLPDRRVLPYLSLGIGESLWVPGKNDDIDSLPMERKVSWSLSPYVSLGVGVSVPLGQHWSLDAGVESSFFFTDALDNVDGGYVSGGSDSNDYLTTMGLAIVYRFGGASESHGPHTPAQTPSQPERLTPSSSQPEEPVAPPSTPAAQEEPVQRPATAIPEADTTRTPHGAGNNRIEPETAEPDTTATETVKPTQPPVPAEEPVEIPSPRLTQPRQTSSRSYLVHVSSFPVASEADTQAATLRNAGYRARIDSVDRGDIGIWYRVFAGPYSTRTEAEQAADRLIQAGLSDYAAVIEEE